MSILLFTNFRQRNLLMWRKHLAAPPSMEEGRIKPAGQNASTTLNLWGQISQHYTRLPISLRIVLSLVTFLSIAYVLLLMTRAGNPPRRVLPYRNPEWLAQTNTRLVMQCQTIPDFSEVTEYKIRGSVFAEEPSHPFEKSIITKGFEGNSRLERRQKKAIVKFLEQAEKEYPYIQYLFKYAPPKIHIHYVPTLAQVSDIYGKYNYHPNHPTMPQGMNLYSTGNEPQKPMQETFLHELWHGFIEFVTDQDFTNIRASNDKRDPGYWYLTVGDRLSQLKTAVCTGDRRILKYLPLLLEKEQTNTLSHKERLELANYREAAKDHSPKDQIFNMNPKEYDQYVNNVNGRKLIKIESKLRSYFPDHGIQHLEVIGENKANGKYELYVIPYSEDPLEVLIADIKFRMSVWDIAYSDMRNNANMHGRDVEKTKWAENHANRVGMGRVTLETFYPELASFNDKLIDSFLNLRKGKAPKPR